MTGIAKVDFVWKAFKDKSGVRKCKVKVIDQEGYDFVVYANEEDKLVTGDLVRVSFRSYKQAPYVKYLEKVDSPTEEEKPKKK